MVTSKGKKTSSPLLAGSRPLFLWGMLGVLILFWVVAIKSLLGDISETKSKIKNYEIMLSKNMGILNKSQEFLGQFDKIVGSIEETKDPEERLSFLAGEIEGLAKKEGLTLTDLEPLPADSEGTMDLLRISIKLEGDMSTLTNFLHRTLTTQSQLRIDRLRIQQKGPLSLVLQAEVDFAFMDWSS